eukprot:4354750-Pyramimonas_sp.AAC.1
MLSPLLRLVSAVSALGHMLSPLVIGRVTLSEPRVRRCSWLSRIDPMNDSRLLWSCHLAGFDGSAGAGGVSALLASASATWQRSPL